MTDRFRSALSMAAKAGKVASGETGAENAIKSGKAVFCIIAEDATDNTKKKFKNMCINRKTDWCFYSDRASIGGAIGREFRSVAVITDNNLAQLVRAKIEEERA
ncbi:MAG: ribosomal L7Ae/L30e/S12e/Gadd45 family protein [Lachnospiraceae bacterium]|nr:ribosomal L7Ae/L30e/S12e/Gadd45 family protein [Lachnospiraceae bacterium]